MARRTKDEAEQTRDAILDAAEKVFYKRGVARTSLDEIARAAKVTRGAVYWHFKDKMELSEAMVERAVKILIDRIENPALADETTGKGTFLWLGAAGTIFWVDPENDIVFVGMVQRR